jgi:hypothetical protein
VRHRRRHVTARGAARLVRGLATVASGRRVVLSVWGVALRGHLGRTHTTAGAVGRARRKRRVIASGVVERPAEETTAQDCVVHEGRLVVRTTTVHGWPKMLRNEHQTHTRTNTPSRKPQLAQRTKRRREGDSDCDDRQGSVGQSGDITTKQRQRERVPEFPTRKLGSGRTDLFGWGQRGR